MINIYFGIDGTDNDDTKRPGASIGQFGNVNSHVKKICSLGFDRFKYIGGPTDGTLGLSTDNLARTAIDWISQKKASHRDVNIFLGGFSRGAAAQIYVAHELKSQGISVKAMYLFDAVDRSWSIPSTKSKVIPSNVTNAFHAMRADTTGSRDKGFLNFGNCGTTGTGGNLVIKTFFSTHGGLGGWRHGNEHLGKNGNIKERYALNATNVTRLQELSVSMTVWDWMAANMGSTLSSNFELNT